MANLNEKVTVLTDELGLQREYREVKRTAKVGELVKITEVDPGYRWFSYGDVGKVIYAYSDGRVSADFTGLGNKYVYGDGRWITGSFYGNSFYSVLEQTDVIVHEGNRYTLEERTAAVGEKVIIISKLGHEDYKIGEILNVESSNNVGIFVKESIYGVYTKGHRVLVPLADHTSKLYRKGNG